MRIQFPVLFVFIIMVFSTSARILISNPVSLVGSQNSGFTDKTQYNAADHAGSPLGWLEIDSSSIKADLSFRYFRFNDELGNSNIAKSLVMPHVRMGKPGIILFDLKYNPDIMEIKSEGPTLKLPLHRFGFGLASATKSGLFQVALQAESFF